MSKYIRIYNRLTKVMGITKLIWLLTVKPSKRIKYIKKYIYGSYVYYKLTGNCDKDYNFYKFTDNAASINKFEDYNKFIMDSTGNIYTTLTGMIFLKFYYLEDGDTKSSYDESIDLYNIKLKNDDLFRGDIKIAFLIKKKYKLPKFITYLIILKICEAHLNFKHVKDCVKCGYQFINKKCHICKICYTCRTLNNVVYECSQCEGFYCNKCICDEICDICYKNKYY